jgi:hypothetical protein
MSNVSNAHNVLAYDAKKSQPLTGQRLAKCRYKGEKAKFASVCTSVPYIDMSANDVNECISTGRLDAHIRAMLENAQDGILRSMYEATDGALTSITDSDINLDACIAYMDAEAQGSRLTKEFLDAWFVSTVQDFAFPLFAEKMGFTGDVLTPEQNSKVNSAVKGYRDMFAALAGGKTFYQPNQVNNLRKLLALIDGDDTAVKLDKRLASMLEVKPIAEMLEL